jgi:hypothetical protein
VRADPLLAEVQNFVVGDHQTRYGRRTDRYPSEEDQVERLRHRHLGRRRRVEPEVIRAKVSDCKAVNGQDLIREQLTVRTSPQSLSGHTARIVPSNVWDVPEPRWNRIQNRASLHRLRLAR